MPLYDFRCDDGHRFERFVSLAHFGDRQTCECGAGASRSNCAPRVLSDSIEPTLGPDGKMHTSLASYRHSCTPEGNPRGERFAELGRDELPAFKAPQFDRKKRREAIKAGIQDVKEGRVPPVVTGEIA
jgi:putative FmdB family regulatory protein